MRGCVSVSLRCFQEYQRWGGTDNRHFLLTLSESGKSKSKEPADPVLGEGLLPGLHLAVFSQAGEKAL